MIIAAWIVGYLVIAALCGRFILRGWYTGFPWDDDVKNAKLMAGYVSLFWFLFVPLTIIGWICVGLGSVVNGRRK